LSDDIKKYSDLLTPSKTRVNKAGRAIINGSYNLDDLMFFNLWRQAHRPVLNTFQSLLRSRTRNKNIYVAQRHKRKSTILNKLRRFPKMELARMDDIAGCRLIFPDIKALDIFRRNFHLAK
jgi:putative GTP pyrophosphokinase